MLSGYCIAQPNNPYNQRGIDFGNSIDLISSDFNAGKVKEFNDETVGQYSKLIPLQNQTSMDLVTSIMKTIKSPGFRIENVINNGTATDYTKQSIKEFFNPKNLPAEDFKRFLSGKADEVTKAKIPQPEKEFLLSMTAIAYNNMYYTSRAKAQCYIGTEQGYSNVPCYLAGAFVGATIGFYACGVWCALGGAVVGAVLGSLC